MNEWESSEELQRLERQLAALPLPGPPKHLQRAVFREFRTQLRHRRQSRWHLYVVFAALAVSACASISLSATRPRHPFQMARVSGRVALEGDLPRGAREISLEFSPRGDPIGNMYPRPGWVEVDIRDGTFSAVTTDPGNPGDGLIVGKHLVSAFVEDETGQPIPLTVSEPEITITQGHNQLTIRARKP